jgi:hypothetical protein
MKSNDEGLIRCGGCNWDVGCLYYLEGDDPENAGLCGDCFLDYVYEVAEEGTREKVKQILELVRETLEAYLDRKVGPSVLEDLLGKVKEELYGDDGLVGE